MRRINDFFSNQNRKIGFAAAMPPQPPVIRIFLIFVVITFSILFCAVWFSACDNYFQSPHSYRVLANNIY